MWGEVEKRTLRTDSRPRGCDSENEPRTPKVAISESPADCNKQGICIVEGCSTKEFYKNERVKKKRKGRWVGTKIPGGEKYE